MTQKQPNVLFLFSDEHDPRHMGVSGSPLAYTPTWTAWPPEARDLSMRIRLHPSVYLLELLATGLHVHDIGYWDNAIAYDGRVRGWGHVMQEHGHRVESIGKLHYVNDTAPTGFSDQTLAMHIWEGMGQVWAVCATRFPRSLATE